MQSSASTLRPERSSAMPSDQVSHSESRVSWTNLMSLAGEASSDGSTGRIGPQAGSDREPLRYPVRGQRLLAPQSTSS